MDPGDLNGSAFQQNLWLLCLNEQVLLHGVQSIVEKETWVACAHCWVDAILSTFVAFVYVFPPSTENDTDAGAALSIGTVTNEACVSF